ncbi:unnamed protein product [Lactuca saligna]|uniref:Uncharacterized protein n=1 Tax=Lactuca saligna TaxID=75948 RepID=A0AA36E4D7_LACSI|nr:unnamed protein product [Lactuca saligna]
MSGGDRRWPTAELGFPTTRYSQINSRSTSVGVFGEDFPNKSLNLMDVGGGMEVIQFSGEHGNDSVGRFLLVKKGSGMVGILWGIGWSGSAGDSSKEDDNGGWLHFYGDEREGLLAVGLAREMRVGDDNMVASLAVSIGDVD